MAWTSPMTAVANATFTAAQFNAHVRDNLSETAPAKATTAGQLFVSTGANAIAARTPTGAYVVTSESTTSAAYGNLATSGPAVTVTTGTQAMVFITCQMANSAVGEQSFMSYAVSGASAIAASDSWALFSEWAVSNDFTRSGAFQLHTGLTAGSNTFTAQYRAQSSGTANFRNRHLFVIPL